MKKKGMNSGGRITLAHGSGGRMTHELIRNLLLKNFRNPILERLDDSAVLPGRIAFSTDSYVISPVFFPGGDIGKLAVCGTVNDLAMNGARPLYLSLALILEEGFPVADLERIVKSIGKTCRRAGVKIVAGDVKVVDRGAGDGIFINTAGIGVVPPGLFPGGRRARPGDGIIVSGPVGDHGIAVLAARNEFGFRTRIKSDCAPLAGLAARMLAVAGRDVHFLRDLTRGGLATCLNEIAASSGVGMEIWENEIPVRKEVRAAGELLGLDPLYVANEGKLVAVVRPGAVSRLLTAMNRHRFGKGSRLIGRVVPPPRGKTGLGRVVLKTTIGGSRLLEPLTGEQLPRIC